MVDVPLNHPFLGGFSRSMAPPGVSVAGHLQGCPGGDWAQWSSVRHI